jgi:hypothetical protein
VSNLRARPTEESRRAGSLGGSRPSATSVTQGRALLVDAGAAMSNLTDTSSRESR